MLTFAFSANSEQPFLSTEDSGLYKSRRLLIELALLYKFCLIFAAGFLGADMLRAAEHKVSMLYPVDLHQTAFQQACIVLWEHFAFTSLILFS